MMEDTRTTPYANSVFEQPWWLDIVAPGKWGEAVVKNGEEVVARLPYVLKGKNITMPSLTQTLGPWIKPEYRGMRPGNTQLSLQKELIAELLSQLPRHSNFSMCFDSANEYILPYRWLGYRYEPSFSYRIKNLDDIDAVHANFNKTAKKNIRRAEKSISISHEEDADLLIDIMEKTFAHQGRSYPISKQLVRKIVEDTVFTNHGKMFVARDEKDKIHACSFLVYDEASSYALLGGSDPEYRNSGAKSLVWKEEIDFASTRSKYFDFEGSNIESIENFVRQFGGERVINYLVSKESVAKEFANILKPRIKKIIGYKN